MRWIQKKAKVENNRAALVMWQKKVGDWSILYLNIVFCDEMTSQTLICLCISMSLNVDYWLLYSCLFKFWVNICRLRSINQSLTPAAIVALTDSNIHQTADCSSNCDGKWVISLADVICDAQSHYWLWLQRSIQNFQLSNRLVLLIAKCRSLCVGIQRLIRNGHIP